MPSPMRRARSSTLVSRVSGEADSATAEGEVYVYLYFFLIFFSMHVNTFTVEKSTRSMRFPFRHAHTLTHSRFLYTTICSDPAEVYLDVQANSRCFDSHRCLAALIDALPVTNSAVSVRDVSGKTPLHLAAAALDFESVSILVSIGAKVDAVDQTGRTPLMSLGRGP